MIKAAVAFALLVPLAAAPAAAQAPSPAATHVIVRFTGTPALAAPHAHQRTAALHADHAGFGRRAHVKVTHDFTQVLNAVAVTTDGAGVARLRAMPGVAAVYPDLHMHASVDPDVALVNAPQVWQTRDPQGRPNRGAGETVAVIDSGVDYDHPDLGAGFGPGHKVVAGYDFINDDPDPMDDFGHGTHVAGIVAGSGARTGVAPDATLTAYKVLDSTGHGDESTVIAGLEAAVSVDNPHRADVVNLSLGSDPAPNDPLERACEDAIHAGVVVVAAAGNSGPGESTVGSPAEAPDVLAVGASASGVELPTLTVTAPIRRTMHVQRVEFSANPPAGGEDLDLVDVGSGSHESDYDGLDVTGKAVYVANTSQAVSFPATLLAQQHGAAAIVFRDTNIYTSPGHQPGPLPDFATGVDDPDKLSVVAVQATASDGTDLQQWLDQGPVRIHIGGTDATDAMAAFSSHGPALGSYALKPDLVAPGVEIGSTWLGGTYKDESGTSMAAPHVAGAAALLREAHPSWTTGQVAAALTGGSKLLPGFAATTVGAGRLDVAAADGLTVLPDKRIANLGLASLAGSHLHASTTVTLTNTTRRRQVMHVDTRQAPGSAGSVRATPRAGMLPPGGRLTVRLTVTGATPTTAADITGWLRARAGSSTLTVPYLLAVRPLDLHADPDPSAAASTVYIHAEPDLAGAPTVRITSPDHHVTTVTASVDHPAWWRLTVPAGPPGLYRLAATASATSGATLTGTSTLEQLGGSPGAWQSVGPDSIGAGRMAFTSRPGRMYALPDVTPHPVVFRTDDGGTTWHELRSMPLGDGSMWGVVADPADPDTVYVAVRGGNGDPTYAGRVLVSHDAGASWTTLPFPDAPPQDMSIDGTGNVLTVVSQFGGPAYVSTDRGRTWTPYLTPDGYVQQARVIGHDLYLASDVHVYVVRDVDTDPAPMQRILTSSMQFDWVLDVTGDQHLLVAQTTHQVYVSRDAGATWHATFTAPDDDDFLTSVQYVNGTIYVGGGQHIWASADGGATWPTLPVPVGSDGISVTDFTVGAWPGDPSRLIVNVPPTGMFATSDNGASYRHIGLPAADVHALVVDHDAAGRTSLLAGTTFSTFSTPLPTGPVDASTVDWGVTGEEDLIGERVTSMAVSPADPKVVYRALANAFRRITVERSDDGGATWTAIEFSRSRSDPYQIVVDPADPDIVYLAVGDTISPGVLVSHDGGNTWRKNDTPGVVTAIAADPHDPNRIWLGGPGGLFVSDDQAQTVTRLSTIPVTALALDQGHLFVGGNGLYSSRDGGHTLQGAHTSGARLTISALLVAPDGTVYAADSVTSDASGLPVDGRGVLASRDGGRSYVNISAGLPDRNVESLAASPDGRWLYAGTGSGSVYRIRAR